MRFGHVFAGMFSIIVLAAAAAGSSMAAPAGAPMALGGPSLPPAGFIRFCLDHLQECDNRVKSTAAVELTAERRRELDVVQAAVNAAIKPRIEPANDWDYPNDGYGDCNRYALEKRRVLEARGWPPESLLLAVALTETGEGHLVLVVRTDAGDLVLDNREPGVVDWSSLPYRWVARQSTRDLTQWVRIAAENG